eukprot:378576-Pelagomonas_calceolata.AAC.4
MGAASAVSFPQLQSCREFHKSVCSPSVRGPASRKQVVTRANWGAPVEFTSAKVLRNREVTPQAHQVFVDVGSLATGYTKPGMPELALGRNSHWPLVPKKECLSSIRQRSKHGGCIVA